MGKGFDDVSTQTKPSISNPKRRKSAEQSERTWYEYHAGFSAGFVEDVLGYLNLPPSSTILDPWNGTGITTQVVQRKGFRAVGIDLNPVMVLVAKSRHVEPDTQSYINSFMSKIIEHTELYYGHMYLQAQEPLLNWFTPESTLLLRGLERAVQTLLVSGTTYRSLFFVSDLSAVSPLAAFFYVALFRVLRQSLARFTTSNPTWIKVSGLEDQKIHLDRSDLTRAFQHEVQAMTAATQAFSPASESCDSVPATLMRGTSVHLPLESSSVDAVVSSPPYCTRIDYAIATLPELRLLGCTNEALKVFRKQMIGTPITTGNTYGKCTQEHIEKWGPTAASFLETVSQHESKASSTYYLRYFLQYFHLVEQSMEEISRVLRPGSPCVLVVQDSHYKEVRLDLTSAYTEIADRFCLGFDTKVDYTNGSSFAQINRGARRYRSKLSAVESVLIIRKK